MPIKFNVFACFLALFPLALPAIPQAPKAGSPIPSSAPQPTPPADPSTLINRKTFCTMENASKAFRKSIFNSPRPRTQRPVP